MELFRTDGHLTDEGLSALIDGTLDEMQRLEAAEHLSFCDDCLLRYTQRMESAALAQPAQPLREGVLARIRRRAAAIFFNRYAAAGAAACLALTLWGTGVFGAIQPQRAPRTVQPPATTMTVTARMGTFLENSADAVQQAVEQWFARAGGAHS